MDIGNRIKKLRIQNGLTLEELASRCELSKGFLSQLERNLTAPSVLTLYDITEALGTTMSVFFQEDVNEKVVFKKKDYFIDEQDAYKKIWIVPNAQKNAMEPIILKLQPGGESQLVSPHLGEEFGYVLKGEITLFLEQKKIKVKSGETFYIKGDSEHYLKNTSKATAEVLWICTPPVF